MILVQTELPRAFATVKDAKLQAEFKKSTSLAATAIAKYIKHLEQLAPDSKSGFAIGRESLEAKLKYEAGVDVPSDALLRIASRELLKTQEAFRKTAALIDPKRDAQSVLATLETEHLKPGTLVDEVQKQLDTLKNFINEKQVVSLPAIPDPVVAEAPDSVSDSATSLWMAGPFESRPLPARYLVRETGSKQSALPGTNYSQSRTAPVRDLYPGRFTQLATLGKNPSLVRKSYVFWNACFVEGWAEYAEQMMIEEGFASDDPKMRLAMLADTLLSLSRLIVGVREHVEGLTLDQAIIFLKQNAYISDAAARAEAERCAIKPMAIAGAIGRLALLKLREDYRRYRKEEFSLSSFHDRLLSNGMAPLWVHRQILMPDEKGKLLE